MGGIALRGLRPRAVRSLAVACLTLWALAVGTASAALPVVAATTDLAALTAAVGGDLVSVQSIAPPGSDPEAYEPHAGDVEKLRQAQLLVRVGLGYDYWLDALAKRAGNPRLMRGGDGYLDASTGIPLLEIRGGTVVNEGGHAHGVANPHYWLDPENALIITANIAETLVRLLPAQRDRVIANRQGFVAELQSREARWRESLARFAGTKLIAYHNSWPYFARRFRLDIVGFVEPRPGVAPSPAHLRTIIESARKVHVQAVLHEPQQPAGASRFVARALDVPVVTLALSVGSVPGATDYLALFDTNVNALAKSLAVSTARER